MQKMKKIQGETDILKTWGILFRYRLFSNSKIFKTLEIL